MNTQDVIVFDNLRQRTGVIGQYDSVSAVLKPFVSTNAHGLLHEVKDHNEVGSLAGQAGKNIRALFSKDE